MKLHLSHDTLSFFPPMDGGFFGLAFMTFLGYIGLGWWSRYSSDGGGVIVQRMSSCKDERHSLIATFYFNIANYALRTWPWILAALASIVLYPLISSNKRPRGCVSTYDGRFASISVKGFNACIILRSIHVNIEHISQSLISIFRE